jgi:glycosyltransferase involved in cell wall biosynthesis
VRETLDTVARAPALAARVGALPVLAWQVSVFWEELRPIAQRVVREWQPDVILVEHDNSAAWIADLPGSTPAVLVFQNVGPRYYESRAAASNGFARPAFRLEARRFRRLLGRTLSRYARLVAVSEPDRRDLEALAQGVPVELVPNGVASDELEPLPPSSEPATLLFTGTLSHPPNSEGIRWFADEVWPRVRAAQPEVRLLVVGRDPPPRVRELDAREGIEVVGPVPAMSPYFARATAVVVPLHSGGGTRLKILEALSCRRAVVSTSVGCEGLDLADGSHLLVADGAPAFAEATLRLLDDAALRERLANAGREQAERLYDWRVLGDRLEKVLLDVVG